MNAVAAQSSNVQNILIILSDTQYADYEADLQQLKRPGVELVFEPSAERALEHFQTWDPALVIVGMTTDSMDGLEFLAILMRRYPHFTRKIVLLPERSDPFPPVIQWHDVAGRSSTEETDLDGILALARSLAPRTPIPVSSEGGLVAPVAPQAVLAQVSQRSRGPLFAMLGGAGLLIALVVVAFAVSGGQNEPSKAAASASTPAEPLVAEPPAVPAAPAALPAPSPAPPAADPASPDLRQLTTLPFSFPKSSREYEVTDQGQLDRIVAAAKLALEGDRKAVLEVGGHSSKETNLRGAWELSDHRAVMLRAYLMKQGIPKERMRLRNYGPLIKGDAYRVSVQIVAE